VCELCTQRAAHEGWIREGLDDARVRNRGEGRSRSLLGRLRTRLTEVPQPAQEPPPAPAEEPVYEEPPPPEEPVYEAPPPVVEPQQPVYEEPHPARSVHAVPTNADLKISRAVELFNASEHPRTVSGVARSLGAPVVAVRPSQTEGSVVMIVVAWELSWYRYEVDLGNEAAGVRVTEQGSELGELDPEDQTANAAADEAGRLHLAA
jgi:hypothetical protein